MAKPDPSSMDEITDQVSVDFQQFDMSNEEEDLISGRASGKLPSDESSFFNLDRFRHFFNVQDSDVCVI